MFQFVLFSQFFKAETSIFYRADGYRLQMLIKSYIIFPLERSNDLHVEKITFDTLVLTMQTDDVDVVRIFNILYERAKNMKIEEIISYLHLKKFQIQHFNFISPLLFESPLISWSAC